MKLVIVSGHAGAGKSVALGMLEDLGYYCIDNLPLSLLANITADVLHGKSAAFPHLAVGIDARARTAIRAFPERINELRASGLDVTVLFLTAHPDVILRRYNETRRKHPLSDSDTALTEAITQDRVLLAPLSETSDWLIDTSRTNFHQLRETIRMRLQPDANGLCVQLQSFGFKHGTPPGVDFMFDARCLPNPHWDSTLRPLTGRDQPIIDFLSAQADVAEYLNELRSFLDRWLPRFNSEDRSYVTIAIGCTGGRHRSVYLVERLAEHFRSRYPQTVVRHTELT